MHNIMVVSHYSRLGVYSSQTLSISRYKSISYHLNNPLGMDYSVCIQDYSYYGLKCTIKQNNVHTTVLYLVGFLIWTNLLERLRVLLRFISSLGKDKIIVWRWNFCFYSTSGDISFVSLKFQMEESNVLAHIKITSLHNTSSLP